MSWKTPVLWVIFLCVSGPSWAGTSDVVSEQPDILLITVDTLRPDAIGWIGGRNSTPNLDKLASEGVRFRAAVTPVPITLPAHASIFTALNPPRHGVRINGQRLPSGIPTLAELLETAGYECGAFVSGAPLTRQFGLDRGFAEYDDGFFNDGHEERSAVATAQAALRWIGKIDGPWFVWVHFWDPHAPYDPPRAFWRPGSNGAYLGEVEYVDHAFGTLVRRLDAATVSDRITIVTGDHGESLGEHGELTHGFFIYDSTVTVPLIIHWPGHLDPVELRSSPRLIDIAPTLLGFVGLDSPPDIDGRSLAPLWQHPSAAADDAYLESMVPWTSYGWSPLVGIRTEDHKIIAAPTPEAYDLRSDPGESTNIAQELGAETAVAVEESLAVAQAEGASQQLTDRQTYDRLTALGYASPIVPNSVFPETRDLRDPKQMLGVRNQLQNAEVAAVNGDIPAATKIFQDVIAQDPNNPAALVRFGWMLLAQGRVTEALGQAERVLQSNPSNSAAVELAERIHEAVRTEAEQNGTSMED